MTTTFSLVRFVLDSLHLGLPLAAVERVVPVVELVPLPGAPSRVLGAFNLEGHVVPVLNLRGTFGLRSRTPKLEDHFLVATSKNRRVALLVDAVVGVIELAPDAMIAGEALVEGLEGIEGVARLDDGLLLIKDPDRFLDPNDRRLLELALQEVNDARD